ncbi:MAG TPA: hypothetical protein VFQ25_14500 [Ktedonobacterales bacterium]|nr:hypothetical protein [Ktedonobacterales bacterium]
MRSASLEPSATSDSRFGGSFWRGVVAGLAPLVALAITLALGVGGAALARALWGSSGFLIWQWIVTGVWVGGLLVAAFVFAYATFRIFRRMVVWRRDGLASQAAGAYWALGFTVLAVLLPVVIAALLPQSPAPPRAP